MITTMISMFIYGGLFMHYLMEAVFLRKPGQRVVSSTCAVLWLVSAIACTLVYGGVK